MASLDEDPGFLGETRSRFLNTQERLALIRAVGVLFQKWELTDSEKCTLLGIENETNLQVWQTSDIATLPPDISDRMADIIGIHKALRADFHEPAQRYAWVRQPNNIFSGRPALEVMLKGGAVGIRRVQIYLHAEING